MNGKLVCGSYHELQPFQLEGLSRGDLASALLELEQQQQQLSQRILSVKAHLNAMSPVNKLPNEILVDIFLLIQTAAPSWPQVLMVCRRWRAVLVMSSRLWCRLDVGPRTPRGRIVASLEYSGNLPLDVRFDRKTRVSTALTELTPHRTRIRSLRFVEARRTDGFDIFSFLQVTMPALRTLHVRFKPYDECDEDDYSDEDDEDDDEPFEFTPDPNQFPSLEDLALRAVALRAEAAAFPLLKTLHLAGCIHAAVSMQMLTSMLSGLDQLNSLSLWRYRPFTSNGFQPHNLPQSLRTLTLEDEEEWTNKYLTILVPPPKLSKLSVGKHAAPDRFVGGLLSTQSIHTCLPNPIADTVTASLLKEVQSASLDLGDSWNRISVMGTTGTRTISLAAIAWRPCIMEPNPIDDILTLFENPLTDLQIFGVHDNGNCNPTSHRWGMLLWSFPSLKRLAFSVEYGAGSVRDEMLAMLDSTTDEEGNPTLVQELDELRINAFLPDGDDLFELLVDVLESRQARGLRLSRLYIAISSPPGKPMRHRSKFFPKAVYIAALQSLVDVVYCGPFGKWFADWNFVPSLPPGAAIDTDTAK